MVWVTSCGAAQLSPLSVECTIITSLKLTLLASTSCSNGKEKDTKILLLSSIAAEGQCNNEVLPNLATDEIPWFLSAAGTTPPLKAAVLPADTSMVPFLLRSHFA